MEKWSNRNADYRCADARNLADRLYVLSRQIDCGDISDEGAQIGLEVWCKII